MPVWLIYIVLRGMNFNSHAIQTRYTNFRLLRNIVFTCSMILIFKGCKRSGPGNTIM